ncbi:hypothetical protein JR316_0008294 [Psilocybe cubensis]|uniref:Uncharacterized protein n=2 Tax=Psilocybe cubensis TaxID=181762 RepID=A0A8H8CIY8_PSICU|nr:hypothetical protein JR316_0008294 [Psilocybe cubensis]KAH9479699.1 hypothetical protein JR316_0008294 [Psilocybe cubensis]
MVVNRKQPSVPVLPAISRSSSTQPVPTKKATKNATKQTTTQNGHTGIDSQKNSSKAKAEKPKAKKRKSKSLLDRLFALSLSIFVIYAFYACRPNPLLPYSPSDTLSHDPNRLCRSLATYRTHVLDPYVLPPLKSGLSFAHSVAEPYVAQVQPHIQPYITPVSRSITTVKPYIVRTVSVARSVWVDTLVPLYTETLKPYWVKAVIPRYNKYVHPRLLPVIEQTKLYYRFYVANPLHIQSVKVQRYIHTIYAANVKPYVIKVQPYVKHATRTAYVTSVKTFEAYKTHAHPRIVTGWAIARPVIIQYLKQLRKLTCKFLEVGGNQLKKATKEVGGLRRTYVDPHVRKIWDKVAEGTDLATPATPTITNLSEPTEPKISSTQETAESIEEPTSATPATSSTVMPTPSATINSGTDNVPAAEPPTPTPQEAAEDEASAPAHAGTVTAATEAGNIPKEVKESVVSDAPAPIPEEESVDPITISEPITSAPTPSDVDAEEEIDLDAFLNDLGVESDSVPEDQVETTISLQEDVTPKQRSEDVLAAIAAKRSEIVDRHNEWFARLDEAIANETVALGKTLEEWRDLKAAEFQTMKGQGALDNLQKDGEKFLKGLESYLKKAEARSGAWKISKEQQKVEDITIEDKIAAYQDEFSAKKTIAKAEKEKWEIVLSKVEEKFSERTRQFQAEIHQWYMGMREKEGEEVRSAAHRIKNLAETAQADLGLDYAWLEDVTYDDWQQYHNIARMSEAFEQTAYGMQNNTLENAPRDPIMPLLDSLDLDMQDVVAGFQVALGSIRGDAMKVYSVGLGQAEEDDSGFFVVNDGQVRRDDLRGVDFGDLGLKKKTEGAGVVKIRSDAVGGDSENQGKDDEVHILPIDPSVPTKEDSTTFDASKVVIGKDKVQIEQALKDVPVEHVHEEL